MTAVFHLSPQEVASSAAYTTWISRLPGKQVCPAGTYCHWPLDIIADLNQMVMPLAPVPSCVYQQSVQCLYCLA